MDLSSTTTDNVTEILEKIIEFTERRHGLLTNNILGINEPDFIPKDMDVTGFAELMGQAVSEHVRSQRLLLRDNDNIKFGTSGNFKCNAVIDNHAQNTLNEDAEAYMRLQLKKLSENTINNEVAKRLLEHKQTANQTFNN
jgi:flagellar basal body rod protein FlgB